MIDSCKLLYVKWINSVLLHSTENYIQYPIINHKKYKKEHRYVLGWSKHLCGFVHKILLKNPNEIVGQTNITESYCYTAEINTML